MKSSALQDYELRVQEIDQLIEAHSALTRFRKAEAALEQAGTDLAKLVGVLQELVNDPGPGRPKEVFALNGAAIVLLSAHLQGYIADVFEEAARAMLSGRIGDVDAFIGAAPTQGNPNVHNITKLFQLLGFADVLSGISWQRMGNDALRKKLRLFNELRNRLAHGSIETVRKKQVVNFQSAWKTFAVRFDGKLRKEIRARIGEFPW